MREISFFILFYKEKGMTSAQALNKLKKLLHADKAGYCGTLDPIAEGLLIVAIGKATRLIRFAQESDKIYSGIFELGKISRSYDIETEAEIITENPDSYSVDWREIEHKFSGEIIQQPPVFSAVKINGQRAYDLARKGKNPDIPERKIKIHSLELKPLDKTRVFFRVSCSPGTYIRSLVNDIGQKTGFGAVLAELLREKVGEYSIEKAVKLSEIKEESDLKDENTISIKKFITDMESIKVSEEQYEMLKNGILINKIGLPLKEGFTVIYFDEKPKMIVEKNGETLQYAGNLSDY